MIYPRETRKFILNSDELNFGYYPRLKMLRSSGHEGSSEPGGTADIIFDTPSVVFLWVPVK